MQLMGAKIVQVELRLQFVDKRLQEEDRPLFMVREPKCSHSDSQHSWCRPSRNQEELLPKRELASQYTVAASNKYLAAAGLYQTCSCCCKVAAAESQARQAEIMVEGRRPTFCLVLRFRERIRLPPKICRRESYRCFMLGHLKACTSGSQSTKFAKKTSPKP